MVTEQITIGLECMAGNDVSAKNRFDLMRALIIDGDEITASYTARAFGRLGISCEIVKDARFALQMMKEAGEEAKTYDLCLLDCSMSFNELKDAVDGIRQLDGSKRTVIACLFRQGSNCENALPDIGGDFYVERPLLQSKLYQMMTEVSAKRG